jgi:hypothetical protein
MSDGNTFIPHKRFPTVQRAEKWWVENSRINPKIFIHYCLQLAPASHHIKWLSYFFHPDYKLVNIIGARYSAKTIISLYAMAWAMAHKPFSSSMIVSVSEEQSIARITELKALFRDDFAFRNVFPHIKLDSRRDSTKKEFSLVDTRYKYNVWSSHHLESHIHPTIKGRGSGGGGLIGSRVTNIMLLDDIVDDNHMTMEAQDKKERLITGTLMPFIHPSSDGRIWNIGTRWMTGDIYGRFQDNSAWKTSETPAIYEDDDGVQHSYWPEYWSLEDLETERKHMDNDVMFGIMFLCKPADATLGIFSSELFDGCVIDLDKNKNKLAFKALYVTSDFAISGKTRADWNVLYACGVTHDNEIIVLDGLRYKVQPETNIDTIVAFCYRINDAYGVAGAALTGVLIEKVGFQSVFGNFMIEKAPYLPVVQVVPMGDKVSRARPIADYMRMERFWISDKIPFLKTMKNEFTAMGFARYDDTVDPFGLLLQHISRTAVSAKLHNIKIPTML